LGEQVWGNTSIVITGMNGDHLVNVLTGESLSMAADGRVPVASILNTFPVGCLQSTNIDTGERS
jgi:maltooligosyltrehalose synthase